MDINSVTDKILKNIIDNWYNKSNKHKKFLEGENLTSLQNDDIAENFYNYLNEYAIEHSQYTENIMKIETYNEIYYNTLKKNDVERGMFIYKWIIMDYYIYDDVFINKLSSKISEDKKNSAKICELLIDCISIIIHNIRNQITSELEIIFDDRKKSDIDNFKFPNSINLYVKLVKPLIQISDSSKDEGEFDDIIKSVGEMKLD